MSDLKVFNYGEQQVRTLLLDGAPWWVLADVCKVLGLKRADSAARKLDNDEKGAHLVSTLRGKQQVITVNESGLYAVILRSDKPEAKEFKRWVTHEVLPSIRKTGSYAAPTEPEPVEPVAGNVPLASPRLPTETQMQRADALIKMADHPALAESEQRQLLDLALLDLTGTGLVGVPMERLPQQTACTGPVRPTLQKRQVQELMALPECICKVETAGMKRCGSRSVQLYTLAEIAEMAGVAPAEFDQFADKHKLKTSFNGEWVRVSSPMGDKREFLYMADVVRMFRREVG